MFGVKQALEYLPRLRSWWGFNYAHAKQGGLEGTRGS